MTSPSLTVPSGATGSGQSKSALAVLDGEIGTRTVAEIDEGPFGGPGSRANTDGSRPMLRSMSFHLIPTSATLAGVVHAS